MRSSNTLIIQKIINSNLLSKILENGDPDDISDLGVFLSAPLSLDSYDFNSSLSETKWFQLDADMFQEL